MWQFFYILRFLHFHDKIDQTEMVKIMGS
jgi:hypothetical protein